MHSVSFFFFFSFLLSLFISLVRPLSFPPSHHISAHPQPLFIWQESESCRWKSFQRISRKLIHFHYKRDPHCWIHLYTSRRTKQEVASGPRLPPLRSPNLSVPVFWRFGHKQTHSWATLSQSSLWFIMEASFCTFVCLRRDNVWWPFQPPRQTPHCNNSPRKQFRLLRWVALAIIRGLAWPPSRAD